MLACAVRAVCPKNGPSLHTVKSEEFEFQFHMYRTRQTEFIYADGCIKLKLEGFMILI